MADNKAPLTPSSIAPKQIPTLRCVPGNRKERGIPIQICMGSRCPKGSKMAKKYAKIVSIGPIIRQLTQQNPKIQIYSCSQQIEKNIHIPMKIPAIISMEGFPNMKLKVILLNRSYDLTLIFFLVYSTSRYRDIIPPIAKQNITEAIVCQRQKMVADIMMRKMFGHFQSEFEKQVQKLRTIIPAAAALQPMKASFSPYDLV